MSSCGRKIPESRRNQDTILGRLLWLENRIRWIGELNRSDLIAKFGISPQQASVDIASYQKVAPGNLTYDRQKKVYLRSESFEPHFSESDLTVWLSGNNHESKELRSIPMVWTGMIERFVPDETIRALSFSFHARRPLRIKYQGMKSPEQKNWTICPHSVVDTGVRRHVRAWVEEEKEFRDLVISRILSATPFDGSEWVPAEADYQWNNFVDIVLVPSEKFTAEQRTVVEKDFMMEDGHRIVRVRTALAYYYLGAMNLVDAVREYEGVPQTRDYGVAVENWRELRPLTL